VLFDLELDLLDFLLIQKQIRVADLNRLPLALRSGHRCGKNE
jgi:hypothetical protein